MAEQKDQGEVNKELLDLLNKLLQTPEWETSQFLKTSSKPIIEMRDKLRALVEQESAPALAALRRRIPTEGHIKVFVSLYQADGDNLSKWQQILRNISEYSVTRPIYAQESEVQALLRSKKDNKPEAYAVVYVAEADVQPSTPGSSDQQGHELLTLRSGSLHANRIYEFVHRGNRYDWFEDALHLKT